MKNIYLSIVVPVYNSEKSLILLYKHLSGVLESIGKPWEIILVNDNSRDNSWKVIESISLKDKNVIGINLMNNFGQHNATMAGLKFAKGQYVVTMDDDLQHPPEEIPKLLNKIIRGNYKVVYGQYIKKNHGWFRDIGSKFVNGILAKITGSGYNITCFRMIKQNVIKEIVKYNNYNIMIDVVIKDLVSKKSVGHAIVKHNLRKIGKSNYSPKILITYALNMIFNHTLWPLRIASILGFLFSIFSIFIGIFYFGYYLFFGTNVEGWTSMMLLTTFFSGILMFMFGIFGEYLGKIYLITNNKPQYIIQDTTQGEGEK